MQHYFLDQLQRELDLERRRALYWRGTELIEAIGEINPDNEYHVDWLNRDLGLSAADVEAFMFALQYDAGKQAN